MIAKYTGIYSFFLTAFFIPKRAGRKDPDDSWLLLSEFSTT